MPEKMSGYSADDDLVKILVGCNFKIYDCQDVLLL